jgi:signal transduction histidine kinase
MTVSTSLVMVLFAALFGGCVVSWWIHELLVRLRNQKSVVRQLMQDAARVRTLAECLDNAPFGYLEINAQGCVCAANKTECKFRGVPAPNQLVGKMYWAIEPIERSEKVREEFLRAISGNADFHPARRKRSDGTEVTVTGEYVLDQGRTVGIRYFSVDASETVGLEGQLALEHYKSRAVLAAFPDAVFHLDPLGYIKEYKAGAHLDLKPELVRGQKLRDVLPPDIQGLVDLSIADVQNSHLERVIEYSVQDGGQAAYFELRMAIFAWKEIAVLIRDITDRKSLDHKLQLHARNLALKSDDLARALVLAQEATQANTRLLHSLSLELRTPLSGIVGLTRGLLDSTLDAGQRSLADAIRTSGQTVLNALNNILDISRLEFKELPRESQSFDVRDAILELLPAVRFQAQQKGIRLEWDVDDAVPGKIYGDPNRLKKVLVNLIENAIKFTVQGQVSLRVELAHEIEESCTLRFSVADTGRGISAQQLPTLWDGYKRADGSKRQPMDGRGFGLVVCRELIALMGGEIAVESAPGEGSTFRFTAVFNKCSRDELGLRTAPRDSGSMIAGRSMDIQGAGYEARALAPGRGTAQRCVGDAARSA